VKRSYGQYCAVAKALDVVGSRWTLLIIRELIGGPRRFRDLMDGLPGIGTNLLSDRLRELQEADVIVKRTLPPPAGSSVYELTERGRALEPAAMELARWGVELLDRPSPGEEFRVHWFMIAGGTAFRPEAARGAELTCELRTNGDVAHFLIEDGTLRIFQGPAIDADISLRGEPGDLIDLFTGAVVPTKAVSAGRIELDGEPDTLDTLLTMFEKPRT
jgi:DNA-binding HxlR family transcriptional regulator/putative sterol carrier protein